MIPKPFILFVLTFFSVCGLQTSEQKITGKSVGKFYLGMPIDEFLSYSKNYETIIDEEYGYLLHDKEKLVLRIWSKDKKKVSGISVYSPKFTMNNGLRVGSKTEEVLGKVNGFEIGINDLDTEEECLLPSDFNKFDTNLQDKIIFKLIVKPTKGKYVGDYKTFQPNEKVGKVKNKGIVTAIEMYTFN